MRTEMPARQVRAAAHARAEEFFRAMSNTPPVSLPLRESDAGALAQANPFRFGPHGSLAGWRFGADGGGKIVALVHGWGGQGTQFLRMARELADRGFEAIVIDAGNHGASGADGVRPLHARCPRLGRPSGCDALRLE